MTSSKTNHWKLGLFVVSGVLLGLIALLWLGKNKFGGKVTKCIAYFSESVTGLEVGSPVKLRGVTIGSVARIGFAEDGRSVQVELDGYVDTMRRLGLEAGDGIPTHEHAGLNRVYAQLASAGITGAKYILVDFVEDDDEELVFNTFDFEPGDDVIRTSPSSLESLENLLMHAAATLPETLDHLRDTSAAVKDLVRDIDVASLESDFGDILTEARSALAALRDTVTKLNDPDGAVANVLDDVQQLLDLVSTQLDEADIPATTASLREAGDSVSDVALTSRALGLEANRVLDDLQGSASELTSTLRAVRQLAELLERDPGALLRGREADPEPAGTP